MSMFTSLFFITAAWDLHNNNQVPFVTPQKLYTVFFFWLMSFKVLHIETLAICWPVKLPHGWKTEISCLKTPWVLLKRVTTKKSHWNVKYLKFLERNAVEMQKKIIIVLINNTFYISKGWHAQELLSYLITTYIRHFKATSWCVIWQKHKNAVQNENKHTNSFIQ